MMYGTVRVKCSECGKSIVLLKGRSWQYRVSLSDFSRSQVPKDSIEGSYGYQCSYTCNDHALLRLQRRSNHLTRENAIKYIEQSETAIRNKGYQVRFPIDIDKVKVDNE